MWNIFKFNNTLQHGEGRRNKYTVTYICANFPKAEDEMSEAMKETAKEASKLRRSDFEKWKLLLRLRH